MVPSAKISCAYHRLLASWGPLHQEIEQKNPQAAQAQSPWCPAACGTPWQGMIAGAGQIGAWEASSVWKRD